MSNSTKDPLKDYAEAQVDEGKAAVDSAAPESAGDSRTAARRPGAASSTADAKGAAPATGVKSGAEASADSATEAAGEAAEPNREMTEEELVEAAIRAGEAAAERDMKAAAAEKAAQAAQVAATQELEELQKALKAAQEKTSSAEDKLLRLQSDWENYRRRTANERLAERERATEKLVEKLLPIVDDMERALAHALKDGEIADASAKDLAQGVQAIHTKLLKVFETENVEVIDPAGSAFDPLEHQAVGRVEDAERYQDTVCEVYQRGYKMAKKVIRPAMVTVSFGGKERPSSTEADDVEQEPGDAS